MVAAAAAVATAVGAVVADQGPAAHDAAAERAAEIGKAWAREYVTVLRGQARSPVGAWPGTMSEARRRIVLQLAIALEPGRLDELARLANVAAKRRWHEVSEPDLEP